MSFFEDNLCQNKITGVAIKSGNYYYTYFVFTTEDAFDDDAESFWVGKADGDGKFWIGLDFGTPTEIGCVELSQEYSTYSTSVVVEGLYDSYPNPNWFPVDNMLPVTVGSDDAVFVLNELPTSAPQSPSSMPSNSPTISSSPSSAPQLPSDMPSNSPTISLSPSSIPSPLPTDIPSVRPSYDPTAFQSDMPSGIPSKIPSISPTSSPTISSSS